MKVGYKGFDKDLKCRGTQFEVSKIYAKEYKESPKLCSDQGYHYCNNLVDCFMYYPPKTSRFCEIEILGPFTDDRDDKSITTSFRIIKEIPQEEVEAIRIGQTLHLPLIRKLQESCPILQVGGSAGLFLHGVRLKRWVKGSSDIDLSVPYYHNFRKAEGLVIENTADAKSGNDFDYVFEANGVKVDCKVDPKQRYEIIKYRDFEYRVTPLLTIIEAKLRYAAKGNAKHESDLKEMLLKK